MGTASDDDDEGQLERSRAGESAREE